MQGIMGNGNMIAVKRLINLSVAGSIQDEQWQFENEARLLMLRHGNIVRLVGYCCEREHRLLCYDYMANRSLDNFLFRRSLQHNILNDNTSIRISKLFLWKIKLIY